MGTRRRNRRRTVQQHHRNRQIREAAVDPDLSEKIGDRYGQTVLMDEQPGVIARITGGSRQRQHETTLDLDGYPAAGAVNGYYCPDCRHPTVTVHADQGVTPMFLACRATDDCHGRAVSMGYQATRDQLPPPTHEWYRPTGLELRRLDFPMQDHIRRGGLALREVSA